MATVVRLAAMDLLEHPERLPSLIGAYLSPGEAMCSLEDIRAWQRHQQAQEQVFDLGEWLTQMSVDVSTTDSVRGL
jgi:hypothetical protein